MPPRFVQGERYDAWTDAARNGRPNGTIDIGPAASRPALVLQEAHDSCSETFPGNDTPNYSEFLYFSFCMAVASQVSDVSTQSELMRKLVLTHSLVSYLFNTAIIALGVNIAASLAS